MKYVSFAIVVLVVALLPACAKKEATVQPQTFEARGIVKVITDSKSYVNIDHEDIPGYMDAMAMFFAVKDSTVLNGIAVGDSVQFTIAIDDMEPAIVLLEVIE
ncbi:MAG: copper-binding protein [Bacteroidota bacterium]